MNSEWTGLGALWTVSDCVRNTKPQSTVEDVNYVLPPLSNKIRGKNLTKRYLFPQPQTLVTKCTETITPLYSSSLTHRVGFLLFSVLGKIKKDQKQEPYFFLTCSHLNLRRFPHLFSLL